MAGDKFGERIFVSIRNRNVFFTKYDSVSIDHFDFTTLYDERPVHPNEPAIG